MEDYRDCIIFLLAKAYQKAQGNFKKLLQPYELTPVQHLILEVLWEEGEVTVGEIGKRLLLDNATLSGVLDRMEEGGWITKAPDAEDRRFYRVYLSAKSKEMKDALIAERKKANEEILNTLRLEEKMLLKRMLLDIMK